MTINGIEKDIGSLSLSSLIESQGYQSKRVVVEIDGVVIQRSAFDSFWLKGDEKIEIVCFVGGG